jgi:hypothetical protein
MEGYHLQYFTHARDTAAGGTIRRGNSWDFGIALVEADGLTVWSPGYLSLHHTFALVFQIVVPHR